MEEKFPCYVLVNSLFQFSPVSECGGQFRRCAYDVKKFHSIPSKLLRKYLNTMPGVGFALCRVNTLSTTGAAEHSRNTSLILLRLLMMSIT